MICFTLGMVFSLEALLGWPVGARAFWINGVSFTVALLLAGAAAATLFEGRDVGGVDLLMRSELSSGRIVLAKWLGACRLLPPLLIVPAWVVIRCGVPLLGLSDYSRSLVRCLWTCEPRARTRGISRWEVPTPGQTR
jgi:hypothetical protein